MTIGEVGLLAFIALVAVLINIPSAIAGHLMLERFEKGNAGAALGFFLGPIGLVIAWVMRDNAFRDREEREQRAKEPPKHARDPHEPRRFR